MRRVTHYESASSRAASLLAEPVLVVKQKLKLVELRNEYGVFDPGGRQIGAVEQVGQSALAFLARVFTSWDVALPITLEIRGPAGPELLVKKPWFTWRCEVTRADGLPLGQIVKQIRLGKARFALLEPGGAQLGEVRAENWRPQHLRRRRPAGPDVA